MLAADGCENQPGSRAMVPQVLQRRHGGKSQVIGMALRLESYLIHPKVFATHLVIPCQRLIRAAGHRVFDLPIDMLVAVHRQTDLAVA